VVDRLRGITALMRYEAKQVPAVELIRIDGQNLAVDLSASANRPA
jgi:hypothetical protein